MPRPARNSISFDEIRHQKDLLECLTDTHFECQYFGNPANGERDRLYAFDQKLARLTRWVLRCFESHESIRAVYLRSRDVLVEMGNGEIVIREGGGVFDIPFAACPDDPEDVVPMAAHAAVLVDQQWMDDGLEVA